VEKLLAQLEEKANEEFEGMDWEEVEEGRVTRHDVYYSIVIGGSRSFTELLLKLIYFEFEDTVKSLPEIAQKLENCISEASLRFWEGFTYEDDEGSTMGGNYRQQP